jgi:hypothetical protein
MELKRCARIFTFCSSLSYTRYTVEVSPQLALIALSKCVRTKDCNVVSVDNSHGRVQLCHTSPRGSSFKVRLEFASRDFTTYVWNGRGGATSEPSSLSKDDTSPVMAAFRPKPPKNWRESPHLPTCGVCPSNRYLVFGCGARNQHVCHECALGACPVVPSDVHPTFTRDLLYEAAKVPVPEHGVPYVVLLCVVLVLLANVGCVVCGCRVGFNFQRYRPLVPQMCTHCDNCRHALVFTNPHAFGNRYAFYNPSIVAHNNMYILILRSSTNSHCHGATDAIADLGKYSFDSRFVENPYSRLK